MFFFPCLLIFFFFFADFVIEDISGVFIVASWRRGELGCIYDFARFCSCGSSEINSGVD